MTCFRIALTAGEPAGIGPDLCIQLAQQTHPYQCVVIADPDLLQQRAAQLGLPLIIEYFSADQAPMPSASGHLWVWPVNLQNPCLPGQLDTSNSRYVLETLNIAITGCMDGLFAAMVTAPVHKGIINDAGIAFTGHTEFIAERCGGTPVMMLATPGLRVALATTHLPLNQVSQAITPTLLESVIYPLHHDLRLRFGIANPNILVCGLNPHAGENGHLGNEEIRIITPTLEKLRQHGMRLQGPLPADTVFTSRYLQQADVVLAMYHDQGLPVLKHMGFGQAVNITLGLPIIRTSVDHGTALELAGSGQADAGSLQFALETARSLIGSPSPH